MNFLILSNGYGEDQVGAKLIEELNRIGRKGNKFWAMPVVGEGRAYQKYEYINILGPNKIFRSGGFLRRLKDILGDIREGLVSYHIKQIKTLKGLNKSENIDAIIAIGDFFLVLISLAAFKKKIYFLPTAKSDYFQKHYWIEKYIVKKICKIVFPRDEITSKSFKDFKINSLYLGNVLMDTIEDTSDLNLVIDKGKKNIVILPGSRNEAYENLEKINKVLGKLDEILKKKNLFVSYFISLPQMLDEVKVTEIIGNNNIRVVKGRFKTLVENAELLIGLAGTANEQACSMGKPVIAFEGYGPQTTKERFLEQKKLLGSHLIFLEGSEEKIAENICRILEDKELLSEIREEVKVYNDSKGTINKIAELIINETL